MLTQIWIWFILVPFALSLREGRTNRAIKTTTVYAISNSARGRDTVKDEIRRKKKKRGGGDH